MSEVQLWFQLLQKVNPMQRDLFKKYLIIHLIPEVVESERENKQSTPPKFPCLLPEMQMLLRSVKETW